MDFDETRLYYSHQQLQTRTEDDDDEEAAQTRRIEKEDAHRVDLPAVRRHFREFLRNYCLGQQRYVYREKLLRMHRRWTLSNANASALHPPDDNTNNTNNAGVAADAARNANQAKLEVDLAHIGEYDASLLGYLLSQPAVILPALEKATLDALQSLLYDMRRTAQQEATQQDTPEENNHNNPDDTNHNPDQDALLQGISIQILLHGNLKPTPLRSIKSEHMNRLLKCPGIVISTSPVKNKAVQLTVRCPRCHDTQTVLASDGPFATISLPPVCRGGQAAQPQQQPAAAAARAACPRFPFSVVPDESIFVDQQTLKLQEAPEKVPTGEMPRSVLIAVERSLVDVAPPGTRVAILCIPTMLSTGGGNNHNSNNNQNNTKTIYLRVVGLTRDHDAHGQAVTFTPPEEQAFVSLSQRPDVFDILSRSIAPTISGSYTVDIKKALVCQLFSGSRKCLPDGVRLRGDINVLLLGDPSMAKSQFLKFMAQVAPVGIYTSGKGSSAAGLTASVVKDKKGEFYLEGGAMVLADGGIVAIDEFDKMRPNDRVAIHEAMEQQTISIAKAGITTVLNSRTSVLAAANPVFGRYDDLKSSAENIDLMTTILSRFDLIFLVRDVREEERDRLICRHVMNVHTSMGQRDGNNTNNGGAAAGGTFSYASGMPGESDAPEDRGATSSNSPEAIAESVMRVATTGQGELPVAAMKKYIQYCKYKCSPRLSAQAGDVLTSSYVKIRDTVRQQSIRGGGQDSQQATIPITVRQLEALVRLSESLAKMRLDKEVQSADVTEALRLFQVSTMAANATEQNTDWLAAAPADMERTEAFLRSRLTVGSMVNRQKLVEEAASQGYNAVLVARALSVLASRGDVLERHHGRLIKRVK